MSTYQEFRFSTDPVVLLRFDDRFFQALRIERVVENFRVAMQNFQKDAERSAAQAAAAENLRELVRREEPRARLVRPAPTSLAKQIRLPRSALPRSFSTYQGEF